jgi:hypothetical protein
VPGNKTVSRHANHPLCNQFGSKSRLCAKDCKESHHIQVNDLSPLN